MRRAFRGLLLGWIVVGTTVVAYGNDPISNFVKPGSVEHKEMELAKDLKSKLTKRISTLIDERRFLVEAHVTIDEKVKVHYVKQKAPIVIDKLGVIVGGTSKKPSSYKTSEQTLESIEFQVFVEKKTPESTKGAISALAHNVTKFTGKEPVVKFSEFEAPSMTFSEFLHEYRFEALAAMLGALIFFFLFVAYKGINAFSKFLEIPLFQRRVEVFTDERFRPHLAEATTVQTSSGPPVAIRPEIQDAASEIENCGFENEEEAFRKYAEDVGFLKALAIHALPASKVPLVPPTIFLKAFYKLSFSERIQMLSDLSPGHQQSLLERMFADDQLERATYELEIENRSSRLKPSKGATKFQNWNSPHWHKLVAIVRSEIRSSESSQEQVKPLVEEWVQNFLEQHPGENHGKKAG